MREQFTFYKSFWSSMRLIKNDKDLVSLFRGIMSYVFDDEEIKMTDTARAMFLLIQPILDKAAERAESGSKRKANTEQTENKCGANAEQTESKCETRESKSKSKSKILPPISPYEGDEAKAEQIADVDDLLPEIAAQLPQKQKDPFDTFWDAYPNKNGDIRQAFIQWDEAVKRTTADDIMSALDAAKAEWDSKPDGKRYIPSAEKWLRNRAYIGKSAPPKVEAAPLGMEYLQRMKDRMGGT